MPLKRRPSRVDAAILGWPMKVLLSLACAAAIVAAPASAADLLGTSPPLTLPATQGPLAFEVGSNWYVRGDLGISFDRAPSVSFSNIALPAARRRRRAAHGRQRSELDDHELHRRRRVRLSVERLAAVRRHVGLPHRPWRIASGDGGLPLRPHRREQPGRRPARLSLRHDQHLQRFGERAPERQRFSRQRLFRSRDLLRLHALRRRRPRAQHEHTHGEAPTTTRPPTASPMPRISPPSARFRRCGSIRSGQTLAPQPNIAFAPQFWNRSISSTT